MKTSKIIFIALLSTIALVTLAALIDLRLNGKRFVDRQKDFKVSKLKIPSIRVLCINENSSIEMFQSDSVYFDLTVMKDSIVPELKYAISGDTLKIMDQMTKIGSGAWVSIHVNDQLNQIILKNSHANLINFNISTLSIDLDQSSINVNQVIVKKTAFQRLNILAKNNSRFEADDINIDSLQVELQHSEVNLWSTVNNLNGSIADSSRLRVRQPKAITLKRDLSSNVEINE